MPILAGGVPNPDTPLPG